MGARRKAEDEDPGAGVSEAWNGFGPVCLVDEGTASHLADVGAIGSQAWATFTRNNCVTDGLQFHCWLVLK